MGIIMNHCKDPYQTTRIQWKVRWVPHMIYSLSWLERLWEVQSEYTKLFACFSPRRNRTRDCHEPTTWLDVNMFQTFNHQDLHFRMKGVIILPTQTMQYYKGAKNYRRFHCLMPPKMSNLMTPGIVWNFGQQKMGLEIGASGHKLTWNDLGTSILPI